MTDYNPHKYEEQMDRYLNGLMDAREKADFEILMLEDESVFARVQLLDAFKRGLSGEQSVLKEKPEGAVILPFAAWVRQPLSLAASVLVAVLAVQSLYSGLGDETQPGSMAIGTVLLLEATRGAAPTQFSGSGPYLFQIDVGLGNQADSYAVTIRSVDNAPVLQTSGLRADVDGWVRLVFAQPLSGEYSVELSWTDAGGNGQLRTFPITVTE